MIGDNPNLIQYLGGLVPRSLVDRYRGEIPRDLLPENHPLYEEDPYDDSGALKPGYILDGIARRRGPTRLYPNPFGELVTPNELARYQVRGLDLLYDGQIIATRATISDSSPWVRYRLLSPEEEAERLRGINEPTAPPQTPAMRAVTQPSNGASAAIIREPTVKRSAIRPGGMAAGTASPINPAPGTAAPFNPTAIGVGGDCVPSDWAVAPANTPVATLAAQDGNMRAAYGRIQQPQNNLGANFAYLDTGLTSVTSGGQVWRIDLRRQGGIGGCLDPAVTGPVTRLANTNGGPPPPPPPPPGGNGTVASCDDLDSLLGCAGREPEVSARRSCGKGYRLAINGKCYLKKVLPAAFYANRQRKAVVSWRDGQILKKSISVARKLKKVAKEADRIKTTRSGR